MIETWEGVNRAYFELSEQGKRQVKEAAIATILHLKERCPIPKIFNCQCPNPMCESLLPIRETDAEEQTCTCGNYTLWIAWRGEGPVVGLVRPVVHEEEL